MPMTPSGYADGFARDNLPEEADWPDFRFDIPAVRYPPRLNAAAELLDGAIEKGWGDRIAVYTEARNLTYSELNAEANRLAHVLTDDLGLITGERVLIHGPNSIDMMVAWYGVLKAGGIAVMTMPLLREPEITKIVQKARIRLALCAAPLKEAVGKSMAANSGLEHITLMGEGGELASLMAGKSSVYDACDTAADDIALLAFTSGTTGEPKACAHFHRSVLARANTFGAMLDPQACDIYAGTPPFAFTFGLGAFAVFPARAGIAVALPPKSGFESLCETIQRFGVTHTFTAPTGYRAMIALKDAYDLSSLRGGVSAGEHLPEATWRAWKDATGIRLADGIGATEMIHIFISATGRDIRPGATGKAVPGYEARVISEDGEPVPDGEIGKLAVCGPTGCLYLADDRQKTYVRNGWNITGDLYRRDPDGYFWYVSRADDLIVASGYNIAGPEVEQALLMHDAVAECAVVGQACEDRGMIVAAHVVLKQPLLAGEEMAKELQDFVKLTIAPYKYPRAIHFTGALPKTQTGKIQRFRLRS